MERYREYTLEGKSFVEIDFSGLMETDNFLDLAKKINQDISKYPKKSVYTITNIENIRWFEQSIRDIVVAYMKGNEPYVKYGAVIGLDGVSRLLVSSIIKMTGRKNMYLAFSKEQAIEWLLKQK